MYGYNGCYSALQWLAVTGDPAALSETDRVKFGLHPLANNNYPPASMCVDIQPEALDE
jgi:hypothetical protein